MSKHVIDHDSRRTEGARLQRYVRQEAQDKASPQAKALQTRKHERKAGDKLRRFAEIDRRGEG